MKIAIVSGATSGLGHAFLEQWQQRHIELDELWLIARHEDRLLAVAEALPWKVRCFAIDLAEAEERAVLFRALETTQPEVQYVVNAAGYGKIGRVDAIQPDEQAGMVDLNCTALVDVSQRVLPYLTKGSVIFEIASVAAFLPQPQFAVYAASKAFVLSFSRALNAELQHTGAHVIAVCPNPMATAFFERAGGTPSAFKRLFFEKPETVAAKALRAAEKGKDVVVSCNSGRFLRIISKILPHRFVLQIEKLLAIDVSKLGK